MPRLITVFLAIFVASPLSLFAQDVDYGFPFGKALFSDFQPTVYASDTSAAAYVIREVGEAHVDAQNPGTIVFTYHVKLRILKQRALDEANIDVMLSKSESRTETIRDIRASSFNVVSNRITETKMDPKSVFFEKNSKFYDMAKFTIPGATAGSVLEYSYTVESPYVFNFNEWEFQSDIPKMLSEYTTVIPGNYTYNITLRGYLELFSDSHTKPDLIKNCLQFGSASADCVKTKYVMKNIPAFKEEEYMTAKSNFLSAIKFELAEVKHFDGRVDKYTKDWKNVDFELKTDAKFGIQLKRGKDVVDGYVDAAVIGETDQLAKAKKIYDFVKFHYIWNGNYGDVSERGIKKAFDEKKGNVGDINLTLIAALKYAGINVEPVLIATRGSGRATEIHPVLSDFNYVIARVVINDKIYLLDAVDDFMPFGSISRVCYNGKGRVMNEEGSYWTEIKPTDRERTVTQIQLKLTADGKMTGTIQQTSVGYSALDKRKQLAKFENQELYLKEIKSNEHDFEIVSYERTGEADLSVPVAEKFGIEFNAFDSPETANFLLNPLIVGRKSSNPFKSDERMFPVDFGVPVDENTIVTLEFPESFEITSLPEKVGVALPNGGGRYVYSIQQTGNKLVVNNQMIFAKPEYSSEEYPYLKEIYSRLLQAQNADVIFKKK